MLGFLTACPGLESPILEFPNYQIKLETSTLTIYGEQQIDVKVNVLRSNGFADPINVVLASLPGITAEPITIPGEASSGVLVVKASVDVVQSDLPVPLNVIGTSGNKVSSDVLSLTIEGASGALDLSYGDLGINRHPPLFSTEPNGKSTQITWKQIGSGENANGWPIDYFLKRFNSDGNEDLTFQSSLVSQISQQNPVVGCVPSDLFVRSNTNIIASVICTASYGSSSRIDINQYKNDGSLLGKVYIPFIFDYYYDSKVFEDSSKKLILVFSFKHQGINQIFMARYNTDDTLDTTFGNGTGFSITNFYKESLLTTYSDISDSILQTDEKLILANHYYQNSIYSTILVRYNQDGSIDTGFGDNGFVKEEHPYSQYVRNAALRSLKILKDGKISCIGLGGIIEYNSNGSRNQNFGDNGFSKLMSSLVVGEEYLYEQLELNDGKLMILKQDQTNLEFIFVTPNGQLDQISRLKKIYSIALSNFPYQKFKGIVIENNKGTLFFDNIAIRFWLH